MPNKKGGYKIVSLKNINLLGASLKLAGLFEALNDSYGKPIQLCDINFNGTKKKDAFVLVEKVGDNIKINDLYGYDIVVEPDADVTVTANPSELPDTASATAGQILELNAQKKPEWKNKPAGGTQLYKHNITIISGSSTTTRVIVIGLSSTEATSASNASVLMNRALFNCAGNYEGQPSFALTGNSPLRKEYDIEQTGPSERKLYSYGFSEGSYTKTDLGAVSSVTDLVETL